MGGPVFFSGAWRRRALPWLVPVLAVMVWQVSAQVGWLSSRVLPAPWAVARAGWALAVSGELWEHLRISALRALWGLLLGGGLGLALGLLHGASRLAETLLDTTLQMIRNIPVLALIPLVNPWFGIERAA